MLSILLRLWLVAELLAFAAVGRVVLQASWPGATAFALGMILLIRALMIGFTWVMAWRHGSPQAPLGVVRRGSMVLAEYAAFVLDFCLIQPIERLWMGPDRLRSGASPVLLVHGYMCNRGCWWWLRRRLEAAGYPVATITLETPWSSIDDFAEQLHARVQAVCADTGAQKVTLIGHSMGGLVSRAYMARHGAARVAGLITIATPHQGSKLAGLGMGHDAVQMRAGSDWLQALAHHRVTVPFVSIRTLQDNFVLPPELQRHPDAVDEPLPGVGHLAALIHPRTLALLRHHLLQMDPPQK